MKELIKKIELLNELTLLDDYYFDCLNDEIYNLLNLLIKNYNINLIEKYVNNKLDCDEIIRLAEIIC